MRSGLVAAWLAGIGIVSWRMVHRDKHIPVPGALLGVSSLFAAMALVSDIWPRATGVVVLTAVGLDVAAFLEVLPAGLGGQITAAEHSTAQAEGVQVA